MPIRLVHDIEQLQDEPGWHKLMEQVSHGGRKDDVRLFPMKGMFQDILMQRDLKAVFVLGNSHGLEAQSETLRITMQARLAFLRATGHRVPGRMGPFYGRFSGHEIIQIWMQR